MEYTQNKAIMFAEWLSEKEWIKRKQGQTHPNKVGKYYSHIQCEYKTIEELYAQFEASEGKNNIESSEPHLPLGDVIKSVCNGKDIRCNNPSMDRNGYCRNCEGDMHCL